MTDDPGTAAAAAAGPMRASDADRFATAHLLQDAVARGLLTTHEGGERMAAAWAARYQHDLPPLTADLPPAPVPAPAAPGWRSLGSLALLQTRTSMSELTAGGIRSRRALATVAGAVLLLLLLVTLVVAGLHGLAGGPHGHGGFPGRR
jgi:hypothetical protein